MGDYDLITYTKHAETRLIQRGISKLFVESVLQSRGKVAQQRQARHQNRFQQTRPEACSRHHHSPHRAETHPILGSPRIKRKEYEENHL
jgi:hypothetical protein